MVLSVLNHLGYGIGTVVIMLERVTIAVAMEIINDRIRFPTGLVISRKKQAVVTVFLEKFRVMRSVLEKRFGKGRGAHNPEKHEEA